MFIIETFSQTNIWLIPLPEDPTKAICKVCPGEGRKVKKA